MHPRKLILLSPDQTEEAMLREHLEKHTGVTYNLKHIENFNQLRDFDLESICHAILMDIRDLGYHALETIRYLGELHTSVALIALCRDHEQLLNYQEVIHFLDDYILAGSLADGELPTRITHAIRRKRKEQELLHEKTLLQSLLDNIPDAIFFKDRESRFTKINRAMQLTFGSNEDILGKSDFDLFSEEHARATYNDEQAIIQTDKPMIAKLEKETFDNGHFNWVNTTKVPLKDCHGRIIGTMGISRNVTELKKAQDTLANERSMLKTILDHALAGIFVKDTSGRYLVINKRHIKYLGASTEAEVLGKTLYDFFEYEEAKRISKSDRKIMDSEQGVENMVDYRLRPDKSELWLLTSKVPHRDEAGRCIGLVGISLDITEHKKNERTLKTTIQILEETRLQLIEAEKLKTVGRLAAGVAHEVKNPLNVVSLGAEYLENHIEEPAEMLQIVRDMREAVKKANDVIFELLDYASPHKLHMNPADINGLITRVLGLMRHNFNEVGIRVVDALDDNIEPVRFDASKMEQVFINLFLNAISVMKKGGTLTVRTSTMRMQSTGSSVSSAMTERFRIGDLIVVVEILDTGTGLSKNEQAKAFEPFFSSKTTGEGTGLGLSVTRSIVEMHHGIISIKNRNDTMGALASILLPAETENKNDD